MKCIIIIFQLILITLHKASHVVLKIIKVKVINSYLVISYINKSVVSVVKIRAIQSGRTP